MKKLAKSTVLIVLISSIFMLMLGCPASNEFGGSFDISGIHGVNEENECDEELVATNPPVFLSFPIPLILCLKMTNNMVSDVTGEGQTVRVKHLKIEYLAANGEPIIPRQEQYPMNIEPGGVLVTPVTLFSYEQFEDITNRIHAFPDPPFQVNMVIKLDYNTSGGQEASVERLFTIQVMD